MVNGWDTCITRITTGIDGPWDTPQVLTCTHKPNATIWNPGIILKARKRGWHQHRGTLKNNWWCIEPCDTGVNMVYGTKTCKHGDTTNGNGETELHSKENPQETHRFQHPNLWGRWCTRGSYELGITTRDMGKTWGETEQEQPWQQPSPFQHQK